MYDLTDHQAELRDICDLDNKTYRSIATGDMIDTVISKKWSKLQFSYKHLTQEQVNSILTIINNNPIYVKAINPLFASGYIEIRERFRRLQPWQ